MMDAVGHTIMIGQHLYIRAEAANSTSKTGAKEETKPTSYKIIGLVLAICSGVFIGVSFVLKKHGLLKANAKYNEEAGEGYGYLKNFWWWCGMTLMIMGEICNFAAYLFADAILVTPLGALSVVITAMLSSIFLKERLSFVGKVGCFLCIVGSVVIAANAPEQASVTDIQGMQNLVISPGFLSFMGVTITLCTFVALWAGPRYGKKSMMVYLTVCSLIGGLSVSCIQGIGAAITAQARGEAQFNKWFTYVLLAFVITTLVTEVIFLNKALNLYNAALVTPTYYVYFTSATIVTSAVLYRGFKGTTIQIFTVVLGFLEICAGVVLLQLSKSAKDVPDTAVFKGDLDQVRTVAEQEEPDYEPRADAIRGGSAIIRSFSKARQSREMAEVRKLKEEHASMQPLREGEQIEFDGIRRRRTTITRSGLSHPPTLPGSPRPPSRHDSPKHPPLGMSKFPEPEDDQHSEADMHPGFLSHFHIGRHRSSKTLPPTPRPESVPLSPVKTGDSQYDEQGIVHPKPHPLTQSFTPQLMYGRDADTSYTSAGSTHVQWAGPSPALERPTQHLTPPPVPPTHGGRPSSPGSAKRQFSFHNILRRDTSESQDNEDNRPVSRGALSFMSRGNSRADTKGHTEEERMGLVHGDSHTRLPPLRSESPPTYSADREDEWTTPEQMRSVQETSFMDEEQTRLPRYSTSPQPPPETVRMVRRNTLEQLTGGQTGDPASSRRNKDQSSSADNDKAPETRR